MNRLYPKSFLRLILIGFGLVSLPLIFALGNAAYNVQMLAEQSAQTVRAAAVAERTGREMAESLTAMERALRQYMVVGETALLDDLRRSYDEFARATVEFARLPIDSSVRDRLLAQSGRAKALLEPIAAGATAEEQARILADLGTLVEPVRRAAGDARAFTDAEIERLREMAQNARNWLLWQFLAAIPVAVLIALWFRNLISNQLRQFDRAIRSIGHADYTDGVTVTGPQDLAYLGRRLDWLRRRLADLEEQKNRFLRHVSHDLKTPLTAIREGTQLLGEGVPGALNEQQKSIVEILEQNSRRLQQLIEELLDYQQAGYSAAAIDPQPVALDVVCTQVVRTHRLLAAARGIRFERRLDPVIVEGDADKLRVVVDNLVTNAIKFSPREGAVTVELEARDGRAVLDVADQGPGVAREERERVFEPFFRGTRVKRGTVKGSGLGLAIAKEHVVAHRGRIEVVEERGKGGHFRVSLPLKWERNENARV